MKPHENLKAWQLAMDLTELVYSVTNSFPDGERFGLVSQMRRAVISAPSNIAEGAALSSKAEFSRFLSYSIGSLNELGTQIEISHRLRYISQNEVKPLKDLLDEAF
jgi:four helix bundle protein